jgi:flagellar biogenesis protein FliO
MEQTGAALMVVFGLLAAVVWKFGPARRPGWMARIAGNTASRRIGVIESRPLASGCTLHLVRVDGREFLIAQTAANCAAVSSWTAGEGETA